MPANDLHLVKHHIIDTLRITYHNHNLTKKAVNFILEVRTDFVFFYFYFILSWACADLSNSKHLTWCSDLTKVIRKCILQ